MGHVSYGASRVLLILNSTTLFGFLISLIIKRYHFLCENDNIFNFVANDSDDGVQNDNKNSSKI